jgi:citrate lyase subunit beta/citryl-CoA lyase
MTSRPDRLRSVPFAPANRPDIVAKLPRSHPDAVVIDLEEAVPPDAKPDARADARTLGERLATDHPSIAVHVRVNAVESRWFLDDVSDALHKSLAGMVVPKLESPA